MRFDGVIKTWDEERGFGFITPTHGDQEIFVHIKGFTARTQRPVTGQRVSFAVEMGPQGKKRAYAVEFIRATPKKVEAQPRKQNQSQSQNQSPADDNPWLVLLAFCALYGFVAMAWSPPAWVAGAYAALSLLTFCVYAGDKSAARNGRWRTKEKTLHLLSLAGGWPGALLARHYLRHKSSKREFRIVFWATVMGNIAGLLIVCSKAYERWQ